MKVTLCLGLVLALSVATCRCRPAEAAAAAAVGTPQQRPPSPVRRDWPQRLSQEQQQHLLSQFLPHVLTELNKHKAFVHEDEGMEALHDHYYPDWMDFGRRSAEDEAAAV